MGAPPSVSFAECHQLIRPLWVAGLAEPGHLAFPGVSILGVAARECPSAHGLVKAVGWWHLRPRLTVLRCHLLATNI